MNAKKRFPQLAQLTNEEICTLLGALLGISTAQYNRQNTEANK